MSRLGSARRLAAGVALALVLGLAGGELALRLARFGPTRAALGPWSAAPPWQRLRGFGDGGDPQPLAGGEGAWSVGPGEPVVRYRLNRLGLRDEREPAASPAPGVCRILAVGDAYTFGYGVAARDAYPARLERRLARRARVEVLNAGFPNLDVEQQRRRLATLLPRLRPRLVLLNFDWWNVPLETGERARPARWSVAWVVANAEQKLSRLGGDVALAHEGLSLARRSLTPAVFPPSGLARELEPLALPAAEIAPRWNRTRTALAAMAAEVAGAGAELILVVTPLDLQIDPARNALYRSGAVPYPAHGFADVDYTASVEMPAALSRFADEAGIALIDTTPAFRVHRSVGLFLARDYHASPAGHRLIAREVARVLLGQGACVAAPASE